MITILCFTWSMICSGVWISQAWCLVHKGSIPEFIFLVELATINSWYIWVRNGRKETKAEVQVVFWGDCDLSDDCYSLGTVFPAYYCVLLTTGMQLCSVVYMYTVMARFWILCMILRILQMIQNSVQDLPLSWLMAPPVSPRFTLAVSVKKSCLPSSVALVHKIVSVAQTTSIFPQVVVGNMTHTCITASYSCVCVHV